MLHQKNLVNNVQTVYSCFFDVYNVENVTIGEDCLGKNPLATQSLTMTLVSAVAGPLK